MNRLKHVMVAAILGVALFSGRPAAACPNCKEALAAQTGDGARLKDGYYYSILLMMVMPFALMGTGAFFVVRAVKQGSLPEI